MSRLRTFVAPWAEIAYLRNELHGAKKACSAEAKRVDRLAARIKVLDRKLTKRLGQARHDQAYIDALESRLDAASIQAARGEVSDNKVGGAGRPAPERPLSWRELVARNPRLADAARWPRC